MLPLPTTAEFPPSTKNISPVPHDIKVLKSLIPNMGLLIGKPFQLICV